ncbi:MAG TPA: hypothetical protein VI357_26700 [Mycobacteriales bacterium]
MTALADLTDPRTYETGVPYELLASLRRSAGVVRVPEPALLGQPAGPGHWLVLRHADVKAVLRDPRRFSSWLGATQVRDPATPADLAYVRLMMLNMDPPEHSRLRRLLHRSFTPRAVAALESRIAGHAESIVDRLLETDDVVDFAAAAADLPLLALADVLGMPAADRGLLFDWSNRVIGFQDPDYAGSARFPGGTDMAARALALRPAPARTAGCPTRGPGPASRTCTRTRTCWPSTSGGSPART